MLKMDEQTKIEKKRATMYMPTQKKNEFQPPMAERADLGFMDIILVFSGFSIRAISSSEANYTNRGL
jgi:hypothetical protein